MKKSWVALALSFSFAAHAELDPFLTQIQQLEKQVRESAEAGELLKDERTWVDKATNGSTPEARQSRTEAEALANHVKPSKPDMDEVARWISNGTVQSWDSASKKQPPTPREIAEQLKKEIRTYVFVSLGMPEAVLKSYFMEAAGQRDMVLVFRGWTPPYYRRQVSEIAKLMPKGKKVNVIIDPTLFAAYNVTSVPVHLHHTKANRWLRLMGSLSIEGARAEMEQGRAKQVVGNLYAIAEPDILKIIEARTAAYDWDKAQQGALGRVDKALPSVVLPVAERNESYLVDPTITVERDIRREDGQLIAAAGTQVNTLHALPLLRPIYVFDPEQPSQIKWVREQTKGQDALVLATKLIRTEDGRGLADVVGLPVYPLNSQLVSRLAIQATPSFIRQEDDMLRVQIFDVREGR